MSKRLEISSEGATFGGARFSERFRLWQHHTTGASYLVFEAYAFRRCFMLSWRNNVRRYKERSYDTARDRTFG